VHVHAHESVEDSLKNGCSQVKLTATATATATAAIVSAAW
jgi:hypothetical protein